MIKIPWLCRLGFHFWKDLGMYYTVGKVLHVQGCRRCRLQRTRVD